MLIAPGPDKLYASRKVAGSQAERPKPLPGEPGRSSRSSLLVDADDEVALADLGARDAQFAVGVELAQYQGVAVPAHELLDQHRFVLLVDDDVAASDRRLERVDVQQPALLVARLHRIPDHVDRVGAAHPDQIVGPRGVADRAVLQKHLLFAAAPGRAADRDRLGPGRRPRRHAGAGRAAAPRRLGARRDRGVVAGMAQHLLLRYAEKGGDLHRLGQLHVPLALQHARDRRGGEAQLAGEIGLAGAGAFQRLLEPHRIHDGGSVIAPLTLLDRIIYRSCVFCKGEQRWQDMTAPSPDGIAAQRSMAAPSFSTTPRPTGPASPSVTGLAAPARIIARNIMCSAICAGGAAPRS